MAAPTFTDEEMKAYLRDGFVLKKGLFTPAEMKLLHDVAKGEQAGFRVGTSRAHGKKASTQLNALGEPRKSEIYHFEFHGRALASKTGRRSPDQP